MDKIMNVLEGKVALVTGATTGMGAAAAQAMADEGATVILAGRREVEGEQMAEDIRSRGGNALFVQTDVTVEDQVARLVQTAIRTYGRLDIAFNNAGGNPVFGPLWTLSDEAFENTLNLNLVSLFYSLKYEIPAMQEAGGSIINTASTAGVQGVGQGISAYVAAKHGVVGLTRAAALEAARNKVRVNAILPGPIATESWLARVGQIPGMVERIAAMIPLGRVGTMADIAALVVFLASDAASFITGAAIPIDGGETAGVPAWREEG